MSESFDDNDIFINQFVIESQEHIVAIEENLLYLEKNIDSYEDETINDLFRSIHTIKGLSGMLEFNNLLKMSHSWETLLDKVRKKKQELSLDIINTSLEALDFLNKIIAGIKEYKTDHSFNISEIVSKLDFLIADKEDERVESSEQNVFTYIFSKLSPIFQKNLSEEEKEKLEAQLNIGMTPYEIKLFLDQDCFEKDLSYLSTCINLEMIGDIINISPNVNNIPPIEDFDPETFDLEINILLTTDVDIDRIYFSLKNKEIRVDKVQDKPDLEKEFIKELTNDFEEEKKVASNKKEEQGEKTTDSSKSKSKNLNQETIRVETTRLDTLLSLLGEQVISKTQLEHISITLNELIQNKDEALDRNKLLAVSLNLNEKINTFSRLSNELQENVMRIRMLPIGNVFNRFNRVVRDMARDMNKDVDLIIEGEETELDKTIIEEISDPLIHIIRNAIDHGLETSEERISLGKNPTGIIHLNAYQQGNGIVISIKDDGKGLNLEKIKEKGIEKGIIKEGLELSKNQIINLIFEPGFSTAAKVTDVSGRGVGMDVVRKNIANLKGTITVETKENEGTTFIIKLPLTLAIIQGLLVNISDHVFIIPLSSVVESYRAKPEEIKTLNGKPALKLRDQVLPVLYFQNYFKLEANKTDKKHIYVVIIGVADHKVAFIVDKLLGQQEIVIKPLNDPFVRIKGIAGATLLGEGITLIIDPIPIVFSEQGIKNFEMAM